MKALPPAVPLSRRRPRVKAAKPIPILRLIALAFTGMAGVALSGCATLTRGTRDEVAVISDPAGATVTTSLGTGCGATPCTLLVGRGDSFSVTVSKAGFESRTVPVGTRLSSDGAATATENITTAGLGLAVDVATGATLEHVPNPVNVTLRSLAGSHAIVSSRHPGRAKPIARPAA